MTIKQQLFNSFVKGIGKTVGTAIVFGFIGTVFYMYSNKQYKQKTNEQKTNEQTTNEQATNVSNDIQMSKVNNNETETDNNTETDVEDIVNTKYKTLFEKLVK
jgi:hypothetical protein